MIMLPLLMSTCMARSIPTDLMAPAPAPSPASPGCDYVEYVDENLKPHTIICAELMCGPANGKCTHTILQKIADKNAKDIRCGVIKSNADPKLNCDISHRNRRAYENLDCPHSEHVALPPGVETHDILPHISFGPGPFILDGRCADWFDWPDL